VDGKLVVPTPDGDMGIHVVHPEGDGPFPVILFFHHGPGLDDGSQRAMRSLAESGYYVVSHDRYHRERPWYGLTAETERDPEEVAAFRRAILETSETEVQVDVQAVVTYLEGDSAARAGAAMGCIGYCIGGRSVVCTMAAQGGRFVAGVALHPSLCTTDRPDSPHLCVPSIAGSLYVAFGADDQVQPVADNEPFIAAVRSLPGGRGEAEVLDGADHGFAVPGRPNFHEIAAGHVHQRALALYDAQLR
jgi:carboxymethylenebutenolidase